MATIVRVLAVALLLFGGAAMPLRAQAPEAEVMGVVQRLFDGMRAGDSTAVRAVFHPDARLVSVGVRGGQPLLRSEAVDAFVQAVGAPHEQVWDERIWDVEIRVDENLATAWMHYAFYLGDQFSHCGVNAFQFFHGSEGWRVIQITDTRRREGCRLPAELQH
jgi:hypothetical protein